MTANTSPKTPATGAQLNEYELARYKPDARRAAVWQQIAKYLQKWISADATSLEVAAGYCDLSNALTNKHRIASDWSETVSHHASPGVETLVGDARHLPSIADASVDVVLASNFVEHLVYEDLDPFFAECHRVLKHSGRLILIQPNYRLCASTYFDDFTHRSVHSHISLPDHLQTAGFRTERVEPRFLPFSMQSRLAFGYKLVTPYLRLPYRPRAGQMLVIAQKQTKTQ
jgi:ubiquinone/menaquinone biosynthesis C-methylase UbiE